MDLNGCADIKVSIIVITYNHEKYIAECLNSLVSQQTNFKYEIIVYDDASTDNTQSIIKDYCIKYPELIIPILQTQNQFSIGKKDTIVKDYILKFIHGKYVAQCEGDDFWNSNTKLQRQFDIMESARDCRLCVHRVQIVKDDGTNTGETIPKKEMNSGFYSPSSIISEFAKNGIWFQTTCRFMRSIDYIYYASSDLDFKTISDVADVPLFLYAFSLGQTYYSNEIYTSYRTMAMGSWTSRYDASSVEEKANHYDTLINVLNRFDEYEKKIYHDSLSFKKQEYLFQKHLILCLGIGNRDSSFFLIKKENRFLFRKLSIRQRIAIRVCCFFPCFIKLHRRVHQRALK